MDILVSNAAVNPAMSNILDCTEEQWAKIFQVNVTEVALLAHLVVPHMKQRGGGCIVLMGSIAGFMPFGPLGAHIVSKTALLGLTKSLAEELAPINIHWVAPGLILRFYNCLIISNYYIN
uniref:Uncharacterized protein n=1 Tax=Callorhinchus milii TaxID=7868 RepID=A0A4W3I863_CALMI